MTTEKKKLYRSRSDRMVSGVCGGMADYFSVDSTVVRLIFALAILLSFGGGLLAYIICLVLMPLEPEAAAGAVSEAAIEVPSEAPAEDKPA